MNSVPCRMSLIEHPAESNTTLDLLSEAADLLSVGRIIDAHARVLEADIGSLREWFHYEAQPTTLALRRHGIRRSELPKASQASEDEGRCVGQNKIFSVQARWMALSIL